MPRWSASAVCSDRRRVVKKIRYPERRGEDRNSRLVDAELMALMQ
jgi:hypothetical protein